MSRFLCLYIRDFPAWAMAYSDPALHGRPLLVYSSGRVVAASPAAREAGVQTGWSLSRAQAIVPDALSLPYHGTTVISAWDGMLAALYELTPCIESIHLGLAIADVRPESAIVPLLRQEQALCEKVQAGAADDRTTAELAAPTTQPGTLRRIHCGRSPAFLKQVPVTVLQDVGVSAATIQRLGWFGWHTVQQLHPLTRRHLNAQFAEGDLLYRYAQARDLRPVSLYSPPESITARYQFEEPVREPYEWEPVLDHLVERAWQQLEGRCVHAITVRVETLSGWTRGQRLLREATSSLRSLQAVTRYALEAAPRPGTAIFALEVLLSGLTRTQPVQGQLFGTARPAVQAAIASVESRFPGLLRRVVTANPYAYLPEEGFRFEPVNLQAQHQAKDETRALQSSRYRSTHARSTHARTFGRRGLP